VRVKYQIGNVLGGEKVDKDVKWLIVFDQYDQPLAAIEQLTDDHVFVTTCTDPKFREVIRRYGIDKMQQIGVADEQP
jgi:hypothetical protein